MHGRVEEGVRGKKWDVRTHAGLTGHRSVGGRGRALCHPAGGLMARRKSTFRNCCALGKAAATLRSIGPKPAENRRSTRVLAFSTVVVISQPRLDARFLRASTLLLLRDS